MKSFDGAVLDINVQVQLGRTHFGGGRNNQAADPVFRVVGNKSPIFGLGTAPVGGGALCQRGFFAQCQGTQAQYAAFYKFSSVHNFAVVAKIRPLEPDENQLDDDEHREQDAEGELRHIAKEARHLDPFLLGDGLDHKVGAVADIGEGAEEDGAQ